MSDQSTVSSSSGSAGSPPPPPKNPLHHLRGLPVLIKEVIAGGIAGATAKTCVAPLERCKILFQTGKLHSAGVVSTITSIARAEGVKGLFRGNGASVLRIVPYASIHFGLYEQYRRILVEMTYDTADPHLQGVSPFVDLLAGSSAGATAVLVTYPLDLVRTRLAFMTETRSLPRSNPSSSSRSGSGSSTSYTITAASRGSTTSLHPSSTTKTPQPQPPPATAAASPSSTTLAQRLAHVSTTPSTTHSIRGVLSSTLRNEGIRGLYHGIGPSMYGILPYAGLKFFVYQHLKQAYLGTWGGSTRGESGSTVKSTTGDSTSTNNSKETVTTTTTAAAAARPRLPVFVMLACGGIAGLIAQTATYPLDVVRRRMQVEGLLQHQNEQHFAAGGGRLPNSTPAALMAIMRRQGWRTLFNGLSINYMKVVPSTAIGFSLYDYFKAALNLPTHL